MDGSDGTRKDTEDTTTLVQIEEVKRAIRALLFVTKLSQEYGSCGKKQEPPVQVSSVHPTERGPFESGDPSLRVLAPAEYRLRDKLRQPLSRPSVMQGLLVTSSLAASVVMFQRRSLREGMPRCRTKIFGRVSKEQTMQCISSRKRI
jgi:hypothetical protein